MADIGVFHTDLMAGGGAEAVGANTLEALQSAGHDVTLYTVADIDIPSLNDAYGTAVKSGLRVRQPAPVSRSAVDGLTAVARLTTDITDLPLLRRAVVERRLARSIGASHRLLVSTDGQFAAPLPVVQYVHFPYFSAAAMKQYGTRFAERQYPQYHQLCRTIRPDTNHTASRTVTNSAWTADVITETLDISPTVIPPPVRTADFAPPAWDDMEDGFVCIGRIHPLKRQHVVIDIVDRLRQADADVHVHLIGAAGNDDYYQQIRALAEDRPYVHLEGRVSRTRLVTLIETHRYGIHARRFEHFGIAIAEMIAGQTIPFVHASGGQQTLVAHTDDLLYDSPNEATTKIKAVRSTPERHHQITQHLQETVKKYDQKQFKDRMKQIIDQTLAQLR